MQAYLVVHQQQRRIERHWCDTHDTWQLEVITSESVPVPCIGVDLALDAIYAGIG